MDSNPMNPSVSQIQLVTTASSCYPSLLPVLFLYAQPSFSYISLATATDTYLSTEDEQLSEKAVSAKTIDVKSANYPPSAS